MPDLCKRSKGVTVAFTVVSTEGKAGAFQVVFVWFEMG